MRDDDCSPPRELVLAWQCQRHRTLLEAGGLYDQPAGLFGRMETAVTVYNAVSSWSEMFHGGGNMQNWLRYHGHDWKLTQEWMKLKNEL